MIAFAVGFAVGVFVGWQRPQWVSDLWAKVSGN
jgi:hypothetical protein